MGHAGPDRGGDRRSIQLTAPAWAGTVDELVRRRADDPRPGLVADDRTWSWAECVAEAASRAAWYDALRRERAEGGPPHVGVLLENTADFAHWLAAAAVGRFVVVGLNATRRAEGIGEDVRATSCDLVVTDAAGAELLAGVDLGGAELHRVGDASYPPADLPAGAAEPGDLYTLIFTSGTTGSPKAVRCSQGKIALSAQGLVMRVDLTGDDVAYVSMPLFHSNAVIAGWGPGLAVGATVALRRRFSASGFLPDVRRHGATYANYVGTPLSYVLAQPPQPDDADNPLRLVFGNEGAPADLDRFASRFGCRVMDGFGSTEGGISISRTPETPAGSLGVPNGDVRVLDPETGEECPRAVLDPEGRLSNPEAVGELVNCDGAGLFEGYWNAPDDDAHRLRDGRYWSGDLGYRDEAGFLWFAGRSGDRLRVSGENFPAAPVARLLAAHPDVVEVVVYAVPDPTAGDAVMAAVVPADGFDPAGYAEWAATRPECSAHWVPRYVRVLDEVPRTATGKVLTRVLAQERWEADGVWLRDGRGHALRPMADADRAALVEAFRASGRTLA